MTGIADIPYIDHEGVMQVCPRSEVLAGMSVGPLYMEGNDVGWDGQPPGSSTLKDIMLLVHHMQQRPNPTEPVRDPFPPSRRRRGGRTVRFEGMYKGKMHWAISRDRKPTVCCGGWSGERYGVKRFMSMFDHPRLCPMCKEAFVRALGHLKPQTILAQEQWKLTKSQKRKALSVRKKHAPRKRAPGKKAPARRSS